MYQQENYLPRVGKMLHSQEGESPGWVPLCVPLKLRQSSPRFPLQYGLCTLLLLGSLPKPCLSRSNFLCPKELSQDIFPNKEIPFLNSLPKKNPGVGPEEAFCLWEKKKSGQIPFRDLLEIITATTQDAQVVLLISLNRRRTQRKVQSVSALETQAPTLGCPFQASVPGGAGPWNRGLSHSHANLSF